MCGVSVTLGRMKESAEPKKRNVARNALILRAGAEGDSVSEREGTSNYDTYDSEPESFDAFFDEVIAPYDGIRDYAEVEYGSRKGELVAAEFGGPARKLFGELNRGHMFRRTAGFVLNDLRNDAERDADSKNGHDVVEADVFFKYGADGLSWHAVEEWTSKNGKPDIIFERMIQGVQLLRRADLYVAIVKRWLSQLSEGGTLFAEISSMMPLEERQKIPALLQELDAEEIAFNRDITCVRIHL